MAAAFFVLSLTFVARASDLVTRNGTTYHNFTVVNHDAGFVTILDRDGGAKIMLKDLPDDLQKLYGYDPAVAAAFVKHFEQVDQAQTLAVAQAQQASQAASVALADAPPPAAVPPPATAAPATSTDGTAPFQAQILYQPGDNESTAGATSDTSDDSTGTYFSDNDFGDGWFVYVDQGGFRHRMHRHRGDPSLGDGQWASYTDSKGIKHREFYQHANVTSAAVTNRPVSGISGQRNNSPSNQGVVQTTNGNGGQSLSPSYHGATTSRTSPIKAGPSALGSARR